MLELKLDECLSTRFSASMNAGIASSSSIAAEIHERRRPTASFETTTKDPLRSALPYLHRWRCVQRPQLGRKLPFALRLNEHPFSGAETIQLRLTAHNIHTHDSEY